MDEAEQREVHEQVHKVHCPRCKGSVVRVLEKTYYVYAIDQSKTAQTGDLEVDYETTFDGIDEYSFLCIDCSHEWPMPRWLSRRLSFG